jgi:hypothetical protein
VAGRRPPVVATLAVLAVLSVGCRLDITAAADVRADGSATLELEVVLDAALLAELDALEVDPTAELTAAAADGSGGWDLERTTTDDGGLALVLEREVADAAEIGPSLRDLAAGLAPEDPALLLDLDVEVDEQGAVAIAGTGALRAPATTGVELDEQPLGPAGDELAAIVADAVSATLSVTVPGPIEQHDADEVSDRTARWELPVGAPRPVTLTASAPNDLARWLTVAAVVGGVLLFAGAGRWWWRRRR